MTTAMGGSRRVGKLGSWELEEGKEELLTGGDLDLKGRIGKAKSRASVNIARRGKERPGFCGVVARVWVLGEGAMVNLAT